MGSGKNFTAGAFVKASAYLSELPAAQSTWRRQVALFSSKGLTGENTTSLEDCLMLYLLIRHFDCRSVFEIGTNVGTTAVVMNEAVKRNRGTCTTCDPVDYGAVPPDSGIRFINAPSDAALSLLRAEAHKIDFVFFDWIPDWRTLRLARDLFDQAAILAVHDYGPNPKGKAIVDLLNLHYRPSGRWFLPEKVIVQIGGEVCVNNCTAFFVPNQLLTERPEGALDRLTRGLSSLLHPRTIAGHLKRAVFHSIRRI